MYIFCRVWGGLRICRCSMFILIAIQAIFELSLENWRRPPGRPHTTWMKNIHYDLSSLDLGIHEARDLMQNRPLCLCTALCTHSGACYYGIGLFTLLLKQMGQEGSCSGCLSICACLCTGLLGPPTGLPSTSSYVLKVWNLCLFCFIQKCLYVRSAFNGCFCGGGYGVIVSDFVLAIQFILTFYRLVAVCLFYYCLMLTTQVWVKKTSVDGVVA